jgi:hypothetical protein
MKARDAAFPTVVYHSTDETIHGDYGMSLRDWFAGQALAGMNLHHSYNPEERKSAALCAYLIADEMLDVVASRTAVREP